MGCKAKYTVSPKGRGLPAPERFFGTILTGGRLQEADGDIRPRSMTECKTEPGLQACVFLLFLCFCVGVVMRMKFNLCLIFLAIFVPELHAQEESGTLSANASLASYASTGKDLPFWLRSNQDGVFQSPNSITQLLRTGFSRSFETGGSGKWDYTFGAEIVAGYGDKIYYQPNQYWVGARYDWLTMRIGAEADSVRFGGLSSTNGNLDASNNARPVPRIALATNGFVSFPFKEGFFSWKANYSEGMILDNSYIQNAHLHHKSFDARIELPWKLDVTFGLEHYVFWGGTSPSLGPLPGWKDYFRYILSMKGGSDFPISDQGNAAGSQFYLYNLEIHKVFNEKQVSIYWNHPFQNRAGMKLANIADGLWGIHVSMGTEPRILNEFVYEWMNTLSQDDIASSNQISGGESYFNNSEYQSGFTHFSQMMGSPLFVPTLNDSGVSLGIEDTRMWMHHLGMKGFLGKNLRWKVMLTYSGNYGMGGFSLQTPVKELSSFEEIVYVPKNSPLEFNVAVANDIGQRFENRTGFTAGLKWRPSEETKKRGTWVIRKRRYF